MQGSMTSLSVVVPDWRQLILTFPEERRGEHGGQCGSSSQLGSLRSHLFGNSKDIFKLELHGLPKPTIEIKMLLIFKMAVRN